MTQQELKEALKAITRLDGYECEIEIVSFTHLNDCTLYRFTFDDGETLALTYDDRSNFVYTPRDWEQPYDIAEPIVNVVADIDWMVFDTTTGLRFAVESFSGMPDKNI